MISGVVLAAGTSSRLGRPKQLLDLGGRPLLQHVVDAAAASTLDEIVVVLGHEAVAIEAALVLPERARTVENPGYRAGQSTSLRTGLGAVAPSADAVAILLGDQPGITSALIDAAAAAFVASGAPALRPVFRGRPDHPVLLGRSVWPAVRAVEGDAGAREVLARLGDGVVELEVGAALLDVDTWEQYEELIAPSRAWESHRPLRRGPHRSGRGHH